MKVTIKYLLASVFIFLLGALTEHYINPLGYLMSDDDTNPTFFEFLHSSSKINQLRSRVQKLLSDKKKEGCLHQVGVFFQDLNSKESFSINGDLEFAAASLLKVPLLMAYFQAARVHPEIIKEEILYKKDPQGTRNVFQVIDPPEPLIEGKKYPVNFLLARMVTISDNIATEMLLRSHPEISIFDALKEMNVKTYVDRNGENIVSVSAYSSIFRVLYFSEYLNEVMSRATLDMLKLSHYRSGLVAGVPEGVEVSHKFGERTIGEVSQLHDCGIVYKTNSPYIICIMTRGVSFDFLEKVIQDVSAIAYNSN